MTIAHIRTNKKGKHLPKIKSSTAKKTYPKSRSQFQISPLDGAQYANISSPQNQTTRGDKPKQQQYIETTRLHRKKKTPTYKMKPVKSIKLSH